MNTAILSTVAERAPEGFEVIVWDIADIPLFNEDLESCLPAAVARLRQAVSSSDGVLLASPEYSHGTSGVLKNVLDWLSRPYRQAPLAGKKVLVLSSSPASTGGIRSHAQIQAALDGIQAQRLDYPQIVITHADKKISGSRFTDERTLEFICEAISHF
ncbi:NADPH-dependent FMN reductase [Pseudomonas sp. NPDC089734]|uniref:NADPH-dependent FMN reductase n=1 Tax=Pseudomonas sp. NPDC089734 TaxID=3364469 RepID=UPI00380382AC